MSRRKPQQPVPTSQRAESLVALQRALARQRKAELVNLLLELAQANRRTLRQLNARLDVTATADALLAATRQAIAEATAFNPRDINHNFAYDHEAYQEVKGNLARLITAGQLRRAMELALELMKRGSHQVEMSDEGLMREDIEDCLSVVLQALRQCHLPAAEGLAWCAAMVANDRVGFLAEQSLQSLRSQFQAAAAAEE